MPISLSVLSFGCFFAAAVLKLCGSKHFDLFVLAGVIFLGAAIPSFEVDATRKDLQSIDRKLINLQTAIEKLEKR